MISRYWKGLVKADKASAYMDHLKADTLDLIENIEGYKSAVVLRKDRDEGVEFVVITEWESLEAIQKFAGENYEQAVVPDKAREMMVDFDTTVIHYEIAHRR